MPEATGISKGKGSVIKDTRKLGMMAAIAALMAGMGKMGRKVVPNFNRFSIPEHVMIKIQLRRSKHQRRKKGLLK